MSLPGDLLVLLWEGMVTAVVQRVRWCPWLNVEEQILKIHPFPPTATSGFAHLIGIATYPLWPCLLGRRAERTDPKVWTFTSIIFLAQQVFFRHFSLKAAVCLLN